jgi:hypothetical protein
VSLGWPAMTPRIRAGGVSLALALAAPAFATSDEVTLEGRPVPPALGFAPYQACSVPQCGQSTEVVTVALKAKPHMHE